MFEETGDEVKSQGWAAFILDINGNYERDEGYHGAELAGRSHQGPERSLLWRVAEPGR
jgi:hypothetical protein